MSLHPTPHDDDALSVTPPVGVLQGFDTFSASGRATAVTGDTKTVSAANRCDYTVCTSTETLMNALDVSAGVAADFGVGGVDAKSQYVQRLELTSTSVVIAIYANVVSGTQTVTDEQLADDVTAPTAADVNAFYQSYGDCFVSSITEGGEYIATYAFYSQSQSEQQQVVASLSAHGVTTSGNVSANVQAAVEEVSSSELVRVSFSQQLFGYSGTALPQPADLVAFALALGRTVPTTPTVIAYKTTGYEHVPGMNATAWAPVVATRNLFLSDLTGDGIAADVLTIQAMLNQIAWLQNLYETFGYDLDATLEDRAQQVDEDAGTLQALVAAIRRDPTVSQTVPQLVSLSYGLPALNVTTPALALQEGGGGGSAWWDATAQTILDGNALQQVTLAGGQYLDSITSVYGGTPLKHGGGGGKASQPLVLQSAEFIAVVSGRFGKYVDQLTLLTTKGQSRDAGGGGGGGAFSWSLPAASGTDYTVVVGFGGRSGRYVDAIGPMTATFSPATWQ